MAGSKNNYAENKTLDSWLGGPDLVRPVTVYIALFTITPGESGGGTEVLGPSSTAYARVAVTNNSTNWPAASGGIKLNGVDFVFPTATANWGTVTGMAIIDSDSGGTNNYIYYADLTVSKPINTGDTAKFAVSSISISED